MLLYFFFAAILGSSLWAQGVWESRAPYPLQATEVSSAAIGSKVYTLGGLLTSGSSTNRLFVYDAFTDTWSEGASLPVSQGVDHGNVAAVNGKLYFLGGIRILTGSVTGQTFEYDPAANTWTERAPMPTARGASGVAALDGRIYVAGGLNPNASVDTVEVYTPATNTWETLPRMSVPRDHLTAQAVNGRIYAIAGRNASGDLNLNEEYDPATRTWRLRAPIPTRRGGLGSGTLGGRIQVFGGEGNNPPANTFPQNEEYDPQSDSWRTLAPMSTPRHGLYGATIDGRRLFAPSGGPQAGATFSTTHEAFYLPPAVRPAINANGIVNGASFAAAIAPDSLASLFGSGLTPGPQRAVRFPLPVQMNSTQVLVNGRAVPLLFASDSQINFLVPVDTASPATVVVRHAGVDSEAVALPLQTVAPGIFTISQDGKGQGAVLLAGTADLASPARPAAAGDVLEIYFTGLGHSLLTVVPEVTIGGVRAELLFAGAAPGFSGLNQVNVRVPTGVTPGNAVHLRLSHVGQDSNVVTIAVR